MIYVVAGNHRQFGYFCVENRLKPGRDATYVADERALLGLRGVSVVTYGTYYDRSDWIQIQGRLIMMKKAGDLLDVKAKRRSGRMWHEA